MKFCVVWSVVSSNSDQAEKALKLEPHGLICRPFLIPQLSHTYYCFCRSSLLQVKVVLK